MNKQLENQMKIQAQLIASEQLAKYGVKGLRVIIKAASKKIEESKKGRKVIAKVGPRKYKKK